MNSPVDRLDFNGRADIYYNMQGKIIKESSNPLEYVANDFTNSFYLNWNSKVYQANSKETITQSNEMGVVKVVIDNKDAINNYLKDALNKYSDLVIGNWYENLKIIKDKSMDRQKLDFKNSLNLKGHYYSVDGKLYNANEFGNYMWGYVMASKYSYKFVQLSSQIGTFYKEYRFDENNEQRAIYNGYFKYWTRNK